MLPLQFFAQNLHFAIHLFAALVFFAVFWLEIDAWFLKREPKQLLTWLGFLIIALSFVVSATVTEQSVLGMSVLGHVSSSLSLILRAIGFISVIIAQIVTPLQAVPVLAGLDKSQFTKLAASKSKTKKLKAVGFGSLANAAQLILPLGALAICLLYWRRATTGLERHYKPVAISFGLLFLYEALSCASLWQNSTNPLVAQFVAAFSPLWIITQLVLLLSVLWLGRWVWHYLTRRFESQLFMILTSLTLAIFLVTTVSFTYLLVNNIQKASLENLQTASSVLSYAVDSKKSETTSSTQSIAENPQIASAVAAKDHKTLASLTAAMLRDKKLSSLIITNTNGQVLLRAEDPERYGDSLSSNTLVRRALVGQSSSGITSHDGVLAPVIYITSAVPIRDGSGDIVGSALASLVANNSFVDGIKHATGLDSAIYAGKIRSATTFVAPDGTSRWVGIKETSGAVIDKVLNHQQTYKGALTIQNRHYLAVYTPLKDADNSVVGMLFIGQPQVTVLRAAAHSIELTFLVTVILLLLSIVPAYLMARYIEKQLS